MHTRIKELRQKLGYSQEKLADKIGVKQRTVAGYENGAPVPEIAVRAICSAFRVRRQWLEEGTGETFEPDPLETFTDDELITETARRILAKLPQHLRDRFREFCRELAEEEAAPGKIVENNFTNFSGVFNQRN